MLWLNDVDAWNAYKHKEVHDKHSNDIHRKIKDMKVLPKKPLFFSTQMKKKLKKKIAIDICKILNEHEPSCKKLIIVEDFLENIKIYF
jgi:cell fate (sporulation/competence/biofilm development) regulator YmcA (YheA/YmcA/DUF963 family)